jgi:DNA-directed RNA polymerase sigma subunit (sigma70/sigma32)
MKKDKQEIPMHFMTQEEVAKELGITRLQARAIELKALKKVKQRLSRKNFKKEDFL